MNTKKLDSSTNGCNYVKWFKLWIFCNNCVIIYNILAFCFSSTFADLLEFVIDKKYALG